MKYAGSSNNNADNITTAIGSFFKWLGIALCVAIVTGSLVALFLWLLDAATVYRWRHEWLLYLLPVAGIGIHFLYKLWGRDAEKGNNLIIDEIHEPGGGVPAKMAPLVIITTIITHLFGGSAGREGTAVQVGGSMAGMLGRWFKLSKEDTAVVLMMGIAAGFGAVFGTPVAGAVFALEVLVRGRIRSGALLRCLVAAIMADAVCRLWGIHHTHYAIARHTVPRGVSRFLLSELVLIGKVILAGIAFGLVSRLFAGLTHGIKAAANRYIKTEWLIPIVGGLLIIAFTYVAGTYDYLGLGVTSQSETGISIVRAFHANGVTNFSWLWKLIFTAITLGMGFKGGEVTPLFFIGAALGSALSIYFGVPADMFAALGFIAVFAGATNTPLACTLMGVELFGIDNVLYFVVACYVAYFISGKGGIYSAQRR